MCEGGDPRDLDLPSECCTVAARTPPASPRLDGLFPAVCLMDSTLWMVAYRYVVFLAVSAPHSPSPSLFSSLAGRSKAVTGGRGTSLSPATRWLLAAFLPLYILLFL